MYLKEGFWVLKRSMFNSAFLLFFPVIPQEYHFFKCLEYRGSFEGVSVELFVLTVESAKKETTKEPENVITTSAVAKEDGQCKKDEKCVCVKDEDSASGKSGKAEKGGGGKKIDAKGKVKAEKKKDKKKAKLANPNVLKWKGKTVTIAGETANDKPEKVEKETEDNKKKSAFGKSCRKKQATVAPNTETINLGPTADKVDSNEFQPCTERKRGKGKADKKGGETLWVRRSKRSESYAAINWLWSDPDNIPVVFDKSFPESSKPIARKAMEMWRNFTCVNFVEKSSVPPANAQYILLTTGGGSCTTDRLGPNHYPPYTTVIDANLCHDKVGNLAHELGHSIGLAHSQKRVDRDSFVSIYLNNMADAWRPQFDKDNPLYFTDWGVPFYYDSIMQYFPYAATVNSLMTSCPLDPLMEVLMGQREEPAFGDLALVNRMYCQESCFKRADLKNPFNGSLSMTISGRTCQTWVSQTPHRHNYASVGNHNYCRNPDKWSGGPWCYTMELTIAYEPCFSACEDLAASGRSYCEGWCYNGGYHDPDTCTCICPRFASGKYCETISQSKKYGHLTCGGKIEMQADRTYGISSPNWPQNYTNQEVCMWWLQAPKGKKVQLTFSDFLIEIPDETGCYDYLEIRKSLCATATTVPEELRFCGDSLSVDEDGPQQILSDDNNVILKFVTDDNDGERGFSIVAQVV